MDNDTQIPIVVPQEGVVFTDIVAAAPRSLPPLVFDKVPGVNLDQQAHDEGVGILDIRSVYDMDGVDTTAIGIANLADPAQAAPDDRPARFLRIVKAVGIPDRDVRMLPGTAYGASAAQLMREIIGYVPVQPDGSGRVTVPATVPLAISVLDRDGRRIGARHQNWLQVRPGETLTCTGCHDHASGMPHGQPAVPNSRGQASIYPGALVTGQPFPNTNPALFTDAGETMAQTLTRLLPDRLTPSVDLYDDDIWTDPGSIPTVRFGYSGLSTPVPTTPACQTAWTSLCRTVIHYEQHIHPLWSVDRGADTCINCHTTANGAPAAELDLSDGPDAVVPEHFRAYRELLFTDTVPGPIDPVSGLPTTITIAPSLRTTGAGSSPAFFSVFATGGTHEGRLNADELRLISEWVDIGAQYYNDPFAVP
jgi:hypothetical protein